MDLGTALTLIGWAPQTWRFLQRNWALRNLKRALNLSKQSEYCLILSSVERDGMISVTGYREAEGLGYIMSTLGLCQPEKLVRIVPSELEHPETQEANLFCLGGPRSNKQSAIFLERYFAEVKWRPTEGHNLAFTVEVDGTSYGLSETGEEFAFVLKRRIPGVLRRTVFVVMGLTGESTCAACYFLYRSKEWWSRFSTDKSGLILKARRDAIYDAEVHRWLWC